MKRTLPEQIQEATDVCMPLMLQSIYLFLHKFKWLLQVMRGRTRADERTPHRRNVQSRFSCHHHFGATFMARHRCRVLEVRGLVGGRSKTQQNAMRDIKEELFDQLRDDAARLNADMVVGVDLRFSDFGSRGNAILATAIGTAVQVQKD
jgi:uncharacterized protein YbjQ (UPF0145 family)